MMTPSMIALQYDSFAKFEAGDSVFSSSYETSPHGSQNSPDESVRDQSWLETPSPSTTTTLSTTATSSYTPVSPVLTRTHASISPKMKWTASKLGGLPQKSEDSVVAKSPKYTIIGIGFVVFMMILFFILSNINSDWLNRENTEEFQEEDTGFETGLGLKSTDPMDTLEIPSYQVNTSRVFYLPGYGKQLSVVREDSQEIEY